VGLVRPTPASFDVATWRDLPFGERVRVACEDWAAHGFGAPATTYAFYLAKIVLYVGVWLAGVAASDGVAGLRDALGAWDTTAAFQKAIVWTMAYEVLGLGAGSGPLTGRYAPPVAAPLHFARPGTVRLPPWPQLPLTRGTRRTVVDAALYVAVVGLLLRALFAPAVTPAVVAPVVVLLPLLGLRDKTVFLAARSEHYLTTLVVFLSVGDTIAGSKLVMVAIWWWAATSKLNHHFPSVLGVMLANHPLLRATALRRRLFRAPPGDLRPSRTTTWLAHAGTAWEYAFPVLLLAGDGGTLTTVGLVMMLAFHTYILSSVPMGVPIEWNVLVMYAAVVLFGANAAVPVWPLEAVWLAPLLVLALVVAPLAGNLWPQRISFLPSMRYYAGNWACSAWLLRPAAIARIEERVTTAAPDVVAQVRRFFADDVVTAVLARSLAFRAMHLHGRIVQALLPRAVDDLDEYEVRDGEIVAGIVLGWNFGDGHLHHEQLLAALQERCDFAPGDVRCVLVESQPMAAATHHWRIVDAATGTVAEGRAAARDLVDRQPWDHTPLVHS
jgi:hypothetical protein